MLTIGILTPHGAAGADVEFEEMAGDQVATRVSRISVTAAGDDADPPSSPSGLRAHTQPAVVDAAATELVPETLAAIAYASTSSAYVIGPAGERDLVERLRERWAIPVSSTPAAVVDALRRFDADRLALVHPPWFGRDRNDMGAAYFRAQGFTVAQAALAHVADDPGRVEPEQVVEWVSANAAHDVDAVFLGGNGFRAARAVGELEDRLGCLVLESNQVLLWSLLMDTGTSLDIRGFGRLFDDTDATASRDGRLRAGLTLVTDPTSAEVGARNG